MPTKRGTRPAIPRKVQSLLWLKAGGRCEFRGCNKILYEDQVTQDPINESNIAHIISWTENGPRGDKVLSPKLATDISNLMLTCPEHNTLIDSGDNLEKYSVSVLQEMKREHEEAIRKLADLKTELPKRIIELRGMIHGQRPAITFKEEADALFPFFPKSERIVIDVCDYEDIETAKMIIDSQVKRHIINSDGSELYAAFIMALKHIANVGKMVTDDFNEVRAWKTLARIALTDNGTQECLICTFGEKIARINAKNTNNIRR